MDRAGGPLDTRRGAWRRARPLLGAAWLLLAAAAGMPPKPHAVTLRDSVAYLEHPAPYYAENPRLRPDSPLPRMKVVGPRRPLYPAYLRLFRPQLARWQFATSLAAWSLCGGLLLGLPGLVAGSLVALLPSSYLWQLMILSEPLNLSLMALLVASSFVLLRRFDLPRFALFALAVVALTLNRDANAYLHPLFAAAVAGRLLWKGRRRWRRAAPRAAAVLGVSLALFGVSRHLVEKHEGYQFMITNVFLVRILPDAEARAHFRARGMPLSRPVLRWAGIGGVRAQLPLLHQAPEFMEWVHAEGLRHYTPWLLLRPASWREAAQAWFHEARQLSYYLVSERELPRLVRELTHPWALAWVHPAPAALLALGLAALLGRGPDRRSRDVAWLLLACLGASYVQGFVGYHGDGIEVNRHMASATVLLQATLLLGGAQLAGLAGRRALRQRRGPARDAPAAPA